MRLFSGAIVVRARAVAVMLLAVLLTAGRVLAGSAQEAPAPPSASAVPEPEVFEVQIDPEDPLLEDAGRYEPVPYTVPGDGELYALARSDDLDPLLQIADDEGDVFAEDDDSGGGTAAWLRAEVDAGETVTFLVAAKDPGAEGRVTLRVFAALETEETLAETRKAREAMGQVSALKASGDLQGARALEEQALEEAIMVELHEQQAEAARLDAAIAENLEKLGYGR